MIVFLQAERARNFDKSLRAVVYPRAGEIEIRDDVPIREPEEDEVLVRVRSSTICGTDLKILYGKFPTVKFPHIPGHEWSGEVVRVGRGVSSLKQGDKVGAEPHVGCGHCARCLAGLYNLCLNYGRAGHAHIGFTTSGGLAEYCTVSQKALHKLPKVMSFDEGAFTESTGIALYALERARVRAGENVAILGPGAIGLIAVQIARKARGASNIVLTGTRDDRLELGRKLGADIVLNSSKVNAVKEARDALQNGDIGFDVVGEFAGAEAAAKDAVLLARRGGRIVLAGATSPGKSLNVDLSLIVRGHLNIYGSLANPKWACERGIALIERGLVNVKPLMSGDYSLEDFRKALDAFEKREGGSYRVMIHP